jgi:DNA-binding transcriptional LysR family regulator
VSSGQGFLTDIVSAFHDAHPEICVDMALTDRLVDLVEDAVDVAVRFNGIHDSGVIARPLGHLDAVLVASPAYLKKHGAPKAPKDLEDHPFLRYDDSNVEQLFGPDGQQAEVKADPWLRLDNSTALRRALLLGTGIGRMGRFLVHEELKRGELVQVLPGWGPALDTMYAVYLPTKFMPVKIKAFVAFLTEAIKSVPGWSPPG